MEALREAAIYPDFIRSVQTKLADMRSKIEGIISKIPHKSPLPTEVRILDHLDSGHHWLTVHSCLWIRFLKSEKIEKKKPAPFSSLNCQSDVKNER